MSFKSCILNSSNFFALKLHETYIDDCRLHDVDFRNAELNKSVITDSDLSNSLFMQTNLTSVDFTGTHSFTIDVRQNKLSQAKFSRLDALDLLRSLDIKLVD
nr:MULTISPECIES: pentapeptide repeat-containing protein [Providencia]